MTTMTFRAVETTAASVDAVNRPSAITRLRTGSAPGSLNGTRPSEMVLTAFSLTSYTTTLEPRSASAMARGSPT